MMIFPLVLLLSSTCALAAPQRGYADYDIRAHTARVCDNVSKWPNSVVTLPRGADACSGMATVFINHKDGQSTITRSTVSTPPKSAMCVRLVGFSLLSRVLESPGGPCDQLQAKLRGVTDWNKFEKIKGDFIKLVLQINDNSNVLFVENKLGSLKSQIVVNGLSGKNPYKSAHLSTSAVKRIEAVSDYLSKTQEFSTPFAKRLDQEIAKSFPGTKAKIEADWGKAVAFAKSVARDVAKKPTSSSARPSKSSARPHSSSAKPSSSKVNPSASAKPTSSGAVPSSSAKPSSSRPASSHPAPSPSAKPSSSHPAPSSSTKPSSSVQAPSYSVKPSSGAAPSSSATSSSSGPVPSSSVRPSSSAQPPPSSASASASPSSSQAASQKSDEIID